MIYTERRRAQSAADTAALAGALAKQKSQNIASVARSRAASNGFNNDGASNIVSVYSPPDHGPYAAVANKGEYIQVVITSKVQTNLLHFVFPGVVNNTVEAVARIQVGQVGPLVPGQALVSLAPQGNDTIHAWGNGSVNVKGGGVFDNSTGSAAFTLGGSGCLSTPSLYVIGGANVDSSGSTLCTSKDKGLHIQGGGAVDENNGVVSQIPFPPKPLMFNGTDPVCATAAQPVSKNSDTLNPGYVNSEFPPSGITKLNPGLYCLNGGLAKMNGKDSLTGDGVTLYIPNPGGFDGKWNGNAKMHLTAPTSGPYKNLLIYAKPHTCTPPTSLTCYPEGQLTINGTFEKKTSVDGFVGTIYAPTYAFDFSGNSTDGITGQVITYTIILTGSSETNITYNPDYTFLQDNPPVVDLAQ
jgi:hypothetical protein